MHTNAPPRFPLLAFLTTLPSILIIVLWLRSYATHDRIIWPAGPDTRGLTNCNGRLQFKIIHSSMPTGCSSDNGYGRWEGDGVILSSTGFMGVEWTHGAAPWEGSRFQPLHAPPMYFFTTASLAIPHRILAVPLLIPSLLLLMRWCNIVRRTKPGQCRNCGYDLRATPTRCPECGMPQILKQTNHSGSRQ